MIYLSDNGIPGFLGTHTRNDRDPVDRGDL